MSERTRDQHPPTLGEVLAELEKRLPEYQVAIATKDTAEKLRTRLDELHEPEDLLGRLAKTKRVLGEAGFDGFDGEAGRKVTRVAAKIAQLRQEAETAVSSLAKSGAVDARELTQLGETLETQLYTFWATFVTSGLPADGVLALFARHKVYRSAIARVRAVRDELEASGRTLPVKEQDVRLVRKGKERALEGFTSLPTLKEKYSVFLLASATTGVPLGNLLDDPELLAWVRQQKLDQELRVTSSEPSEGTENR